MLTNDGGKVATRAGPQFYALQDHMQHARETNHDWQHFCTQTRVAILKNEFLTDLRTDSDVSDEMNE